MPIILRLDRIMVDRKVTLKELAESVGISYVNLSKIKTGKVQGVRFSTLEAICQTLDCQPGDILEYVPGDVQKDDGKGKDEDRRVRTPTLLIPSQGQADVPLTAEHPGACCDSEPLGRPGPSEAECPGS